MNRVELIDKIMREKLGAQHVGIIDDSHKHKGHKSGGGGHFSLVVVSPQFEDVNLIDRVRMVYTALDEQINKEPKEIHALQIKTYTPEQWSKMN